MIRTVVRQDDHLVFGRRLAARSGRGRPSRRPGRTRPGIRPKPFVRDIEPAIVIRDVIILVKDIAVLGDRELLRAGHDDRPRRGGHDRLRGCDDRSRCNDRLRRYDRSCRDDGRGRFHDDRGRARFNDRAHQIHDVRGKLDAVIRPGRRGRFMVACVSCRCEDCRRGERDADGECLVDGLLGRVSYG